MIRIIFVITISLLTLQHLQAQCSDGESFVEINVDFDYYSNENSFTLSSITNGTTYLDESGFGNGASDYYNSLCLQAGLYSFTMNDSYGDGQYSWSNSGSVAISVNGFEIWSDAGNWGSTTGHTFMIENTGIEGCTDEAYFEFDEEATVDDGSCTTMIVYGCTDDDYLEHFTYIELDDGVYEIIIDETYLEPNIEDGSCETLMIKGCVDPLYLEYNDEANVHDPSLCLNLIVEGCTNYLYLEFNIDANVDDGSCENLIVFGCLDTSACNFDSSANTDDGMCDYEDENENGICDSEEQFGCTSPSATNYNPIATIDDGSCIIYGCTYATACNYIAEATTSDGSCIFPETGYNCDGVCLLDDDGDGICNIYEIEGCTDLIACNFDETATENAGCIYPEIFYNCDSLCINDIDLDGVCDELEIMGCTDENACNFNALATDESECTYETLIYDCEGICWNDTDEDGVCDEEEISGCTDPTACNFNPLSTDEGECEYADPYYSCDGSCINDEDEDGICDELEIEGCTDESACNYNSSATNDDGSCEYVEVNITYDYTSFLLIATSNVIPPNFQWSVNGEDVLNTSDRINVYVDGIYTVSVYNEELDCWGETSYLIEGVGLDEINNELKIYPNPIASSFTIEIPSKSGRIKSIELIDLLGEITYSTTQSNLTYTLDDVAIGTYILKVETENRFFYTTIQKR